MKVVEAAGMLVVGAAAAVAAIWYVTGPEQEQQTGVINPAFAPITDTDETEPQVTRAVANAVPLGAADRIHAIIAQSEDTIDSVQTLTPEQEEVVAFFEKIARDRNAEGTATPDARISFDNITIDRLTVRYYYTTSDRYEDLDRDALLAEQAVLVHDNICHQESMRRLISEFGVDYNYRFISKDFRFIGEVHGDLENCPS
jgi:hypothetical protein